MKQKIAKGILTTTGLGLLTLVGVAMYHDPLPVLGCFGFGGAVVAISWAIHVLYDEDTKK